MTEKNKPVSVFLIDDDPTLLKALAQAYDLEDFEVVSFSDSTAALNQINPELSAVVVTDVRMPQIDGIELFKKIKAIDEEIPVILMTGHADVPMVLQTIKHGAFDFFTKPIDVEQLLTSTRRAIETRRLILENRELRALAKHASSGDELIGETQVMQRLNETIQQVAQTDVDLLIEGETGTGKGMVAKMLHNLSPRSSQPLITINCAALPSDLAEGEIFGFAFGSHPIGRKARPGKIELSHKGSLVLDEIESLSLALQGQLLPVLEERRITPVGGDESTGLDLRIIATATKELTTSVAEKEFRADLLYRLNTIKLHIPPLRDRRGDIPLLFASFLASSAEKLNKKLPRINASARRQLVDYDWPGNVRELKNFAQSLVLGIQPPNEIELGTQHTLPELVERFESNTIRSVLEQTNGDVRNAIELLGIPRNTFYDKLTRHEIEIKQYRKKVRS